jgi:hypothetical protein
MRTSPLEQPIFFAFRETGKHLLRVGWRARMFYKKGKGAGGTTSKGARGWHGGMPMTS